MAKEKAEIAVLKEISEKSLENLISKSESERPRFQIKAKIIDIDENDFDPDNVKTFAIVSDSVCDWEKIRFSQRAVARIERKVAMESLVGKTVTLDCRAYEGTEKTTAVIDGIVGLKADAGQKMQRQIVDKASKHLAQMFKSLNISSAKAADAEGDEDDEPKENAKTVVKKLKVK